MTFTKRKASQYTGIGRQINDYERQQPKRDAALSAKLEQGAIAVPEFGYRQMACWLGEQQARVRRLWKHLNLGVKPAKKQPLGDPVMNEPDQHPTQAESLDHVWTYDMMHDRLSNGRSYRILNIIDEYSRGCLAMHVAWAIKATDVAKVLLEVMKTTGRKPKYIRSDNGPEFAASWVAEQLSLKGVQQLFIAPGSP